MLFSKIVIHGGIDGYSRLIMYFNASNNCSTTVLSAFVSAVEEYGLPSRIRIDRGGENVLISQMMLEHPERGPGRTSVIVGRSVYNQRIERFWCDLYSGCVCFFFTISSKIFIFSILSSHLICMPYTLSSFPTHCLPSHHSKSI